MMGSPRKRKVAKRSSINLAIKVTDEEQTSAAPLNNEDLEFPLINTGDKTKNNAQSISPRKQRGRNFQHQYRTIEPETRRLEHKNPTDKMPDEIYLAVTKLNAPEIPERFRRHFHAHSNLR